MKAFWIGLLAWLFQSLVAAGAYVCYTVMWDSARADDRWFFAFALVSVIVALVALMLLLTIVGRQLTIPSDELKDWRDSAETIASEVCPTDEKHCGCVLGLRKRLAQTTSILRLETCSCGTRPDPNDVPLDNVPGHHDFSCRFRELMQPVLAAADAG